MQFHCNVRANNSRSFFEMDGAFGNACLALASYCAHDYLCVRYFNKCIEQHLHSIRRHFCSPFNWLANISSLIRMLFKAAGCIHDYGFCRFHFVFLTNIFDPFSFTSVLLCIYMFYFTVGRAVGLFAASWFQCANVLFICFPLFLGSFV